MADDAENEEEEEEVVPEELIALLTSDAFGLRTYRCNAPPVQPFDGAEDEAQATLARVFAPGPWRIDGMRERRSATDAIVKDLEEKAESDYAKAIAFSGVTALRACAINGYLTLFKLLVDVGKCDPTTCASAGDDDVVAPGARARRRRQVDVQAARPEAILDFIKSLPVVEEAQKSLDVQLVSLNKVHTGRRGRQGQGRAAALARRRRRASPPRRKRKEKEKAQQGARRDPGLRPHAAAEAQSAGRAGHRLEDGRGGQEKSLSLLEDEQGTHKQDHNRFNMMKGRGRGHRVGDEEARGRSCQRGVRTSARWLAPRRSLDGARAAALAASFDPRRPTSTRSSTTT